MTHRPPPSWPGLTTRATNNETWYDALGRGVSDYAPSIVWRIFAINAAAFAALFLVHGLGIFAGLAKEPRLPARERST
jgi:hypothetical protein